MGRKLGLLGLLLAVAACSGTPKAQPAVPADRPDAATLLDGAVGPDAARVDAAVGGNSGGEAGTGQLDDAGAGNAATCPEVKAGVAQGELKRDALAEVSGLVVSRKNPGVLWLHNDSGDSARVFAVTESGSSLTEIALTGAGSVDWEDIAIGPGPDPDKTYLYVGDVGDNDKVRASVQVYRFEEPALNDQGEPPSTDMKADRIDVTYATGSHDCETLIVDPLNGDLYLVTKGSDAGVYRIPALAASVTSVQATKVANVPVFLATGGDALPDGSGVAVRSYTSVRFWPRAPEKTLGEAFFAASCALKIADFGSQGEAFGFTADGKGYYTVAEGKNAPVYFYAFE